MEQHGYEYNNELPTDVRSLPSDQQDVYRFTYNASLADQQTPEAASAEAMRAVALTKAYNPSQPRDPKGVETGGEWSSIRTARIAAARAREQEAKEHDREELIPAPDDRDEWPEHIKNLYIPPAWKDLNINPDADGDLLVVGTDAKGRQQYVYSEKYTEGQMRAKFARIQELDKSYDKIHDQVNNDLNSADPTIREHAAVTSLIMSTGIRPGSSRDRGGDKRAYGATTLLGRHVVVDEDGSVRLQFTGKKGVSLNIPVHDQDIADALRDRAKQFGPEGRLFENVSDRSLRDYVDGLDGGRFSPKDFRTYLGTSMARAAVDRFGKPKSFAEYKRSVREVGKLVSQRLGNTPTVALQSYVDPSVFLGWRADLIVKALDYDVWFGTVGKDDYDWRSGPPVGDPDDLQLDPTPPDVVAVLGFDPKEA
jgi:DNA topoisomerase-1